MSLVKGYIRLSLPGGSPAIPSLTIAAWPEGGGYLRSELGFATLAGRSLYGTPQIEGGAVRETYQWAIACHLTAAEARQLGAMAKWQDRLYKGIGVARGDGKLILRDGVEPVDSEPTPHSRSLWESTAETWNAGYVWGFADFNVKLDLPPEHRKHEGVVADGTDLKLVTFTMSEV